MTLRRGSLLMENQDFTLEDNVLKGPERPADLISWNIGEVLLDAFDRNPDHVSQIDAETNSKTTYAEMKDRITRCALWLEKQGLGPDSVVSVCTPNQLDAYIPVFATFFEQAVLNPWRHDLTLDQVRARLQLFQPKVIFACVDAVGVLVEALALTRLAPKIIVFGEHPNYPSLSEIIQSQSSTGVGNYRPANRKRPKDVVAILATSGTSARPKGVMISAEALLTNALDHGLHLRRKIALWFAPIDSLVCNCMMLAAILQDAVRIISSSMEPRELCKVIEKYKVNYVKLVPPVLNALARFDQINNYNMDCLEIIRTSGMRLNRVTFDKLKSSCLRDKIHQVYDTTEVGAMRLHQRYGQSQQNHHSVGFVSSNLQLKIMDRVTRKTLGPNVLGEMLIKTSTQMVGYYKNPELTAKVVDGEGWYHTGDVGYYDETGEIFIMGRIADAFVYRGREMFTTEIEDIMWEHPDVMNVAVVAIPHETVERLLVAFVVVQAGKKVVKEQMIELLKTSDDYKTLPLNVHFLDAIPSISSTKVAKTYLIELALKLTLHH